MKYEGGVAVIEELERLIKQGTWYNEGKDGGRDGVYDGLGAAGKSNTFARKFHIFHFYDLRTFPIELYYDMPVKGEGRIVVAEGDLHRLYHILPEARNYLGGGCTYSGSAESVGEFEELLRTKSFHYHDKSADKENSVRLLRVMHNFRAFDIRLVYDYRNGRGKVIMRDDDVWRLCKVVPATLQLLAQLRPTEEVAECNV